jgi:hypothetical protein
MSITSAKYKTEAAAKAGATRSGLHPNEYVIRRESTGVAPAGFWIILTRLGEEQMDKMITAELFAGRKEAASRSRRSSRATITRFVDAALGAHRVSIEQNGAMLLCRCLKKETIVSTRMYLSGEIIMRLFEDDQSIDWKLGPNFGFIDRGFVELECGNNWC